jgi:hypothetical protein
MEYTQEQIDAAEAAGMTVEEYVASLKAETSSEDASVESTEAPAEETPAV